MSETIVIEVDEDVGRRLRQRAKLSGQTIQELTRELLSAATKDHLAPAADASSSGLGATLAERFQGLGFEETDFPEWKGNEARHF